MAGEHAVDEPNTDVTQGTLDMLILKTLSLEPMHGFGIARRIEQISRGVFKVNPGSLLTALQRLERALFPKGRPLAGRVLLELLSEFLELRSEVDDLLPQLARRLLERGDSIAIARGAARGGRLGDVGGRLARQ